MLGISVRQVTGGVSLSGRYISVLIPVFLLFIIFNNAISESCTASETGNRRCSAAGKYIVEECNGTEWVVQETCLGYVGCADQDTLIDNRCVTLSPTSAQCQNVNLPCSYPYGERWCDGDILKESLGCQGPPYGCYYKKITDCSDTTIWSNCSADGEKVYYNYCDSTLKSCQLKSTPEDVCNDLVAGTYSQLCIKRKCEKPSGSPAQCKEWFNETRKCVDICEDSRTIVYRRCVIDSEVPGSYYCENNPIDSPKDDNVAEKTLLGNGRYDCGDSCGEYYGYILEILEGSCKSGNISTNPVVFNYITEPEPADAVCVQTHADADYEAWLKSVGRNPNPVDNRDDGYCQHECRDVFETEVLPSSQEGTYNTRNIAINETITRWECYISGYDSNNVKRAECIPREDIHVSPECSHFGRRGGVWGVGYPEQVIPDEVIHYFTCDYIDIDPLDIVAERTPTDFYKKCNDNCIDSETWNRTYCGDADGDNKPELSCISENINCNSTPFNYCTSSSSLYHYSCQYILSDPPEDYRCRKDFIEYREKITDWDLYGKHNETREGEPEVYYCFNGDHWPHDRVLS